MPELVSVVIMEKRGVQIVKKQDIFEREQKAKRHSRGLLYSLLEDEELQACAIEFLRDNGIIALAK